MKNWVPGLIAGIVGGVIAVVVLSLLQVDITTQNIIEAIDPKAKCFSLLEENSKLLEKYRGVGRMENWLVDDVDRFWEGAQKFEELKCFTDVLTNEEFNQVRAKHGLVMP